MVKMIKKVSTKIANEIKNNFSDYALLSGLALLLRYIYIVKGVEPFLLSVGVLLILFSLIREFSKR